MVLDRRAVDPAARAYAANHSAGQRRLPFGRLRTLIALALSCALVALLPAAHASPPDPTWMGGIYDAADYDDVVLLLGVLESLADEGRLSTRPLVAPLASMLPATRPGERATEIRRSVQPRAPPKP